MQERNHLRQKMWMYGLLILGLSVFIGCAAYTELKPKPPILPNERGHQEVKQDKKRHFELKKNNKYFIRFPKPMDKNFYLVLHLRQKSKVVSGLATAFQDKKGIIRAVPDQTHQPDSICVFAVDSSVARYFWVIESVLSNHPLILSYRYVPVWRYQYEIKSAEMKSTLQTHRVDSANYRELNVGFHFENFSYDQELGRLQKNITVLEDVLAALEEIKKTFPDTIFASSDPAYLDYRDLKLRLETEIRFQKTYRKVVALFADEYKTRGDTRALISKLPNILAFFDESSLFEPNVLKEAKEVLIKRLVEISEYYRTYIRQKNNTQPIPLEIEQVEQLHRHCSGKVPDDFQTIARFIRTYNQYAEPLQDVPYRIAKIRTEEQQGPPWPDDLFYPNLTTAVMTVLRQLPDIKASVFRPFEAEYCVTQLLKEVDTYRKSLSKTTEQYTRAGEIVRQINVVKSHSSYREVIRILKQNRDLDFLLAHYTDVDERSLSQQKARIEQALKDSNWAAAEEGLSSLFADQEFLEPMAVKDRKLAAVREMEVRLYETVEQLSLKRAGDFIAANLLTTENVDQLYLNEAFTPVYDIQFNRLGEKEMKRRKDALLSRLQTMKTEQFPASAIEALYKDFTANPASGGVAKGRAIARHGFFYKGKDRKILNMVAEVDPRIAKWITKAATYRKVYVLPVTDNPRGENEYLIRLNIQIESDAQFPVFDVNVRLPEEVARNAARQQWYKEITINKRQIKNEGRFSITAPTADNGYESLITPVQMNKGQDNILEIRFRHSAYKVLEVSVMAQKPLIKKN